MPCIAEFTSANPELKIELLLNDRFVDLISEGFDVTLRIGNLADYSLIARPAGFTQHFIDYWHRMTESKNRGENHGNS